MAKGKPICYILTACVAIESLVFLWLCSLEHQAFMEFVWSPDTGEYNRVALGLVENAALLSGPRTLGYPLFLSLGYLIAGRSYGAYLVIAAQLIINIVFTWLCWKLLKQITPATGIRFRAILTLVFFWAGMGVALYLLSDFLASFFFGVFLYGMLFWRSRSSIILSGTSLALATLTRPTFTLLPLLLPLAAYLVRQFTSKVPWYHLVAFTMFSCAATGISVAYQYNAYGYLGPSPIVVQNIQRTLYYALEEGRVAMGDHKKEFEEKIAKQAGHPYTTLLPGEQEKYARQIFYDELISHPREIMLLFIKTIIKYMFVPIEYMTAKLAALYISEHIYDAYVRPILGLVCLPIWLFSLSPPFGSSKKYWMYYFLVMIFLFYILGVTAINQLSGERIRFPVLAFMLPVMAWNVHTVYCLSRWWIHIRTLQSPRCL